MSETSTEKVDFPTLCANHGLVSHQNQIIGLARQATEIYLHPTTMDAIGVGETRFGGIPDLPVLNEYPTWRGTSWPEIDGEPAIFLAQFNLKDLHSSSKACNQLPDTGSLLFFYALVKGKPGMPGFVLYTKESELQRASEDWQLPQKTAYRPAKLSFRDTLILPHTGSFAVRSLKMLAEELDRYDSLYRDWLSLRNFNKDSSSWLFGYPLIFNCPENPEWYDAENSQLLIQIASNEECNMMLGDLGLLSFLINTKELESQDFSHCFSSLEAT